MSRLPEDIISVLSQIAPIFSARVWPQAQTLLLGALLAPGKRTVSAVLEVMGLGAEPQFQTYHRLLNRCVWSPMAGSQRLFSHSGQYPAACDVDCQVVPANTPLLAAG